MKSARLTPGTFLGREVSRFHTDSGTFVECTYAAGGSLAAHAHQRPHFCLVIEGQHLEQIGRRWHPRRRGALTFLPAGCEHAERQDTAGRHVMIEFDQRRCPGEVPTAPTTIEGWRAADLLRRFERERRIRDVSTPLALEGALLELLAVAWRGRGPADHGGRRPDWINALRDAIVRNPTSRPPSLAAVGEATGLHPTQVARAFRRATGETIGGFSRRQRLTWAAGELAGGRWSLADLAEAAGFSDQSHFTRHFRRHFSVTPALWRRQS